MSTVTAPSFSGFLPPLQFAYIVRYGESDKVKSLLLIMHKLFFLAQGRH